jgi:hypothetical protein
MKITKAVFILTSVSLLFFGCGSGDSGNTTATSTAADSNQSLNISVDGKIFSVPSPVQTAFLIKKTGVTYDKNILNAASKYNNYSSKNQKALNLGIYGADLAYVTMYEQTQDDLAYFQVVKKLADDLGLGAAFDKALFERFQKNIGKKDSILALTTAAFRSTDAFLKNNERTDVGAMIVAGGWIEAFYFATSAAKSKNNEEINRRIAEQKITINNLISLIERTSIKDSNNELVKSLKELQSLYDGVEYKYVYEKPVTDDATKTTVVNSKTDIKITPQQIEAITKKVEEIRKSIIG